MSLPDEFIQAVFEELEAKSHAFAKARALRIGLEEQRKIVKAQLMKVMEAVGERSFQKQERDAYAHPTYVSLVARLQKAVEEEANAEYACKLCEMQYEAWRTLSANRRAIR